MRFYRPYIYKSQIFKHISLIYTRRKHILETSLNFPKF
ncbi:hypothetical protein NM3147_2246, partial [Neisseria meningitidis NM3147]